MRECNVYKHGNALVLKGRITASIEVNNNDKKYHLIDLWNLEQIINLYEASFSSLGMACRSG